MDYLGSYRFVFNSRNWAMNLLFVVLCSLIPAIGPIVLMGYFFEVIDDLVRRRQRHTETMDPSSDAITEEPLDALPARSATDSESYPDFTFDRFMEYLTRGVWPFLVGLIVNLVLGMIFGLFWVVGMGIVASASAGNSSVLPLIFFAVFFVFYLVLATALGILTLPLYLRAGLSCDFGSAFSMDFYRDFLKRVGKEVVLAKLFLVVSSSLVSGLGFLLCCIGIYPALALTMFASHHLDYQLYELYLERGGEPIERKESRAGARREVEEERSTDIRRPEHDEW